MVVIEAPKLAMPSSFCFISNSENKTSNLEGDVNLIFFVKNHFPINGILKEM
jgi:hypothetical protein